LDDPFVGYGIFQTYWQAPARSANNKAVRLDEGAEKDRGWAMSEQREQAIRERAYALWEQDGRPDGRSVAHWSQAEMEIAVEQALAAQDKVKAVKARRRKSAAKSLH
jgi:hypothetical protein